MLTNIACMYCIFSCFDNWYVVAWHWQKLGRDSDHIIYGETSLKYVVRGPATGFHRYSSPVVINVTHFHAEVYADSVCQCLLTENLFIYVMLFNSGNSNENNKCYEMNYLKQHQPPLLTIRAVHIINVLKQFWCHCTPPFNQYHFAKTVP